MLPRLVALTITFVSLALCATSPAAQQPEVGLKAPDPIRAVPVQTLEGMPPFSALKPSGDGKTLRTCGGGSCRVWDVASGKLVERVGDPLFSGESTPTPDGKLWLLRRWSQDPFGTDLALVDPSTRKVVRSLERPSVHVWGECFTVDGKELLALEARGGRVVGWDVTTGKRLPKTIFDTIKGHIEWLGSSPDGKTFAVGIRNHHEERGVEQLRLLDARSGEVLWPRAMDPSIIVMRENVAFSPDSRLLAVASWVDNQVRFFDTRTGRLLDQAGWKEDERPRDVVAGMLPPATASDGIPSPGIRHIVFAPDGRTLLVAGRDDRLTILEVATGMVRWRFVGTGYWVRSCIARGFLFVTSSSRSGAPDSRIELWDRLNPTRSRDQATPAQLHQLLGCLDALDAAAAAVAMQRLVANPESAVAVLGEVLRAVPAADDKELAALLDDLDHDDAPVRDRAERRLQELGASAQSALLAAAKRDLSAEVRQRVARLLGRHDDRAHPDRVRALRAVEVLEYIASDKATKLLERLGGGAPGAYLTDEARAALARLDR